MTNSVVYQTYFYSKLKIKELFRINKLLLILGALVITYASFTYGLFIASAFERGISNFFVDQSSTSSFVSLDFSGLLFRDLLVNGILMLYLTFLTVNLLRSFTGVANPFINNHLDANFQQLIPINPFVSYFSCKINFLFKGLIVTLLFGVLLFLPLIFVLKISYFVIIPILFNYFLGFELISIIGNIVFFLIKPLRADKDWAVIFADKGNIVVSGSTVLIPLIFAGLANQGSLFTFQLLQKYAFLPFVNIAIANTGLLFRSGIPSSVFIGMASLIIEIFVLELAVLLFIKFISATNELGDLLPILEFLNSRQLDSFLVNDEHFIPISVDKVDSNTKFSGGQTNTTLLTNELLLIKRSNDLRFNIFLIFFLSILSTIFFFLGVNQNSDFYSVFFISFFELVALELDSLVKILYSISLNTTLLFAKVSQNVLQKVIFSIIFFIPILIIFVFKINIVFIALFVALFIVAELLNRFNIRNFVIINFIGIFLGMFFFLLAR